MENSELHIVFGSGPLGRWTADALVRMGKTVRVINRSGKMENPPAGVTVVASDALDIARNIDLTRGAAAVYQCAQPPYHQWVERFPPLQAAILDAAAVNGARLVVGDNLYMYGQFSGVLREESPTNPISKKGRVRAAMAQKVLEAHAAGKVQAVIGRASDFFGPYDTALTGYAIAPALAGKPVNLLGSDRHPHTFTYIKDFGALLANLGTRSEVQGQVWFAPGSPPITQAEFVQLIETELVHPVKRMVGGPLMMRFLGWFNKEIAETVEMLYQWTAPFVVDSSKAERALGMKPTPLNQALRETLAWLRLQVTPAA